MSFYVNFKVAKDTFNGVLTTTFSKPFKLRGDWEVGLFSCNMSNEKGLFYVFTDVVDFSYINEVPLRFLDIVNVANIKNSKPIYNKVIKKTISSINMEFKRDPLDEKFEGKTDIICILHFRKI